LIHGDLFYDNVLFHNRKFKAMIDFEEICNYCKVFDLGMALMSICAADGKLNLENACALVKGYLDNGKLEEAERNALQLMVETAAVATSCWRFWKYNIHDPTPERAQTHWEMAQFAEHVRAIPKEDFTSQVFAD
jgi:homoserine kinase type II